MVIFVTTKSAYSEMQNIDSIEGHSVWFTCNALSDKEYEELWDKQQINASVRNYEVNPKNKADMGCALPTIKEYYPCQNIWVQIFSEG